MKKMFYITAVVILLAAAASFVMANKANDADEFCITITPKTLVLSNSGTVVSVHSNIPYSLVVTASLTLNGLDADYTKADACGDLVVKFTRDDVKGIVEPGEATLTLSGVLYDGSYFQASDTILVKK